MIICTIYGVSKIHSAITFKQLIEKYRQLYLEDVNFFKKLFLEPDNFGDIITFYNLIYIKAMKDFLIHKTSTNKPRIEILHPDSSLRANIPTQMISSGIIANIIKSPIKSPFRTPRTEILFAPCEAFSPITKFNVNKKIVFGEPTKKPKIINDILQVNVTDIGPVPSLKKDPSFN